MFSNDSPYPKSFGQTPKPTILPNFSPDPPNQLIEVYSIWGRNGFFNGTGFFGGARDLIPFWGVEQSWKVAPPDSNLTIYRYTSWKDLLNIHTLVLRPDFHYGCIFIAKYENRNVPWTDLNIYFQISPGVSWGSFTIGAIKKSLQQSKNRF